MQFSSMMFRDGHWPPRVLAALLCLFAFIGTSRAADEDPVTLRIRFGMKDQGPTDWSGKLVVDSGKVERGNLLCLAAFGSGFTWAASLLRY